MYTFQYVRACVRASKIVVPELSDQNTEGFTVPPDRPTLSKRSGVHNYYCTYLLGGRARDVRYFTRSIWWYARVSLARRGGGEREPYTHDARPPAHIENNKLLPDHHRSDTTRVHGFSRSS